MSALRSRTNKTLGVVSGELVIRGAWDEDGEAAAHAAFVRQLDGALSLRRLGEVQARRKDAAVELHCRVEYGPVFGACEWDLRRLLPAMQQAVPGVTESAVLGLTRRELRTPEQVQAAVGEVQAMVDDLSLSLERRRQLSKSLERLRRLVEPAAV